MTDPGFALQKAIMASLRADALVQSYLGTPPRLFDDPPRDMIFPYVSLGPGTLADNDTASERGHVHSFVFDIWSRQGGRREVRAIIGAIETVLHDAVLALDGHTLVNLRFQFADTFRDPDGETMRGTVRYRAVTAPL